MIITIDGKAASGKSTLAKQLKSKLPDYIVLESGLFYRSMAYLYREIHGINVREDLFMGLDLDMIEIREIDAKMDCCFRGESIVKFLRDEEISSIAAEVAVFPKARDWALKKARAFVNGRNVIAEGRDTGSKVFPMAEVKFFLQADSSVRVSRRAVDLGQQERDVDGIRDRMEHRDNKDITRSHGALVCPEGAHIIDSGVVSVEEMTEKALSVVFQTL